MAYQQKDPQYKLRYSPDLKKRVEESATAHSRTINAEIIHRLEHSFAIEKSGISEDVIFTIGLLSASIQAYVASLDRDKVPQEQRKLADTLEQVARAVYEKLPKQQPTDH